MRTVYKYVMNTPRTVLHIPYNAEVVHAGIQNELPVLWIDLDTNDYNTADRIFEAFATGVEIPDNYVHLGTIITKNELVWHIFEWIED